MSEDEIRENQREPFSQWKKEESKQEAPKQKNPWKVNDEFNLDSTPVYLQEKVHSFSLSRKTPNFEEILEIDIHKETLLETEQSIQASVNKFADSFKTHKPESSEEVTKPTFNFNKL
jgi:hypothetical protein